MNNRPTPETDAFITSQDYSPTGHQWRNFTRKLERERDEAREKMADALQEVDLRLLDFERMKQERDEAREKMARQANRIRYLEGATNHACGTPLSVALKERDEARDAIVGWENKWKCAVDMAARAELERDELKYSLKIRAINESLRYSKDRNESDNIISKLNFKL